MCTYTHIFHNIENLVGQRNKKFLGNSDAGKGKFFPCHFPTLVTLYHEPWSRIQLPDARSPHHIVPSSEECAMDMLDIWNMN